MVGENPIMFLRHSAIERSQAALEVSDGYMQFHCGEGAGNRRVRISVNEHPVWSVLLHDRVEGGKDSTGLDTVAARPNAQVHIRCGDRQV